MRAPGVTVVLGVDFWSGFGPVSAMKSGIFGPGNRTKSPVSAVKSELFGPGNRTKSPVFQCDFGEKAENIKQSREIELFEKRNRAFRAQGWRRDMRREGTQATISLTFTHPV